MAKLVDLAPELIVDIFHYLEPRDVEALTLTCRYIYFQAGPRLVQEEQSRLQFSHVHLFGRNDLEYITDLAPPCLASFYVRDVSFYRVIPRSTLHGDAGYNEMLDNLDVMAAGYLKPDLFTHEWDTLLATGGEGMAVALSLGLMPNLCGVIFSEQFAHQASMISSANGRDNALLWAVSSANLRPVFTKISRVTLTAAGARNSTLAYYAEVFLMLPSMRTLQLQDCKYMQGEGPMFQSKDYSISNVTLADSLISAEALDHILQPFKTLTSFHYTQGQSGAWKLIAASNQATGGRTSQQWDAYLYRDVLHCVKNTLQHLTLELHTYTVFKGIDSLTDFHVLKTVTINEGILAKKRGGLVRLAEIFPRSIEEVNITHLTFFRKQVGLFADASRDLQTQLFALRYVVLGSDPVVIIAINPSQQHSCFEPDRLEEDFQEPERRSLAEHLTILSAREQELKEQREARKGAKKGRRN